MGRARPACGLDLRPRHGPQCGPCRPRPTIRLGRAKNCVLWAGLLGTAQMYTYSYLHCTRGDTYVLTRCSSANSSEPNVPTALAYVSRLTNFLTTGSMQVQFAASSVSARKKSVKQLEGYDCNLSQSWLLCSSETAERICFHAMMGMLT
jgi:hypothetical protein